MLYKLVKLSGAELIDLYEFNHFEFTGIFGYLARKHSHLTYDRSQPVKMDKGLIVLEHLLVTPLEIFGVSVGVGGGGGVRGYVCYDTLKMEGKEAIKLLKNLDLTKETACEVEKNCLKEHRKIYEMEVGAVEMISGKKISENVDWEDRSKQYQTAKEKIIKALEKAMEKKMGILMAGF